MNTLPNITYQLNTRLKKSPTLKPTSIDCVNEIFQTIDNFSLLDDGDDELPFLQSLWYISRTRKVDAIMDNTANILMKIRKPM